MKPLTIALMILSLIPVAGVAADRPLLVTVDDLPLASSRLHPDAEERRQEAERDAFEARSEIVGLFDDSAAAWNRGDLESFCSHYADDARFTSPSGLVQGRDEVLARYQRRYPDGDAMGQLTFQLDEVRLLTGTEVSLLGDAVPGRPHGAAVTAQWTLSYPDREPLTGRTLVVLQRIAGRWQIVEDASM